MRITRTPTAAALLSLAVALTVPAPSHAATASVAAEDEILVHDATAVCTLGYTYTSGGATFGVTAGHCTRADDARVIDRNTGATGRVAITTTDPDPLADDFALIDFGAYRSSPDINGMPVGGMGHPDPGKPLCRSGIRTGTTCGQLDGRLIGFQYTSLGMPGSIPGDSGAPVWQPASDGTAVIVRIWLGEHNVTDTTSSGRFTSPTESLSELALADLRR
jgi:hypothetical protein